MMDDIFVENHDLAERRKATAIFVFTGYLQIISLKYILDRLIFDRKVFMHILHSVTLLKDDIDGH